MTSSLDFDVVVLNHMNIPTILLGTLPRANRREDPDENIKPRIINVEVQFNYKNQISIERAVDVLDTLSSTMVRSSNAYKTIRRNLTMLRDRGENENSVRSRYCNRNKTLVSSCRLNGEDIRGNPSGLLDEVSGLLFVDMTIFAGDRIPVHPHSELSKELIEQKAQDDHIVDTRCISQELTFVDNTDRFGKLF